MKKKLFEVFFIILFLILANIALFNGGNFIIDEDGVSLYQYSLIGSTSSGWNYYEGMGSSGFYGDPGAMHFLSPTSVLMRLFSNKELGYSLLIIAYSSLAIYCAYLLLKRINANYNPYIKLSLACLLFISPLRYELIFQRHWISLFSGTALILIYFSYFNIINYKKKLFYLTCILFTTLVFGSIASLLHLIAFSFIFFIIIILDEECEYKLKLIKISKFLIILLLGILITITLNSWEFIGIIYEHYLVGYVRDPIYIYEGGLLNIPNLKEIAVYVLNLLHSGFISPWIIPPIIGGVPIVGWKNITPIFPIIFLITIFNRKKLTSIELSSVVAIITYITYDLLIILFPGIYQIIQGLINLYPLEKFEPCIYILELIVIFSFFRLNFNNISINIYTKFLFYLLFFFYSIILLFLIIIYNTNYINLQYFINDLLSYLNLSIINRKTINELFDFQNYLLFFNNNIDFLIAYIFSVIINLFILGLFIKGIYFNKKIRGYLLIGSIITTNLLMCAAIYPLNKTPNLWDINSALYLTVPDFKQSRVARVRISCQDELSSANKLDEIKECQYKKLALRNHYLTGFRIPPETKNLNQLKSYTQKDIAIWVNKILDSENYKHSDLRELTESLHLTASQLYNLSGTKYIYSQYPINNEPKLIERYRGNQLFVYENINAFDYAFIANKVIYSNGYDDLTTLRKNEVILEKSKEKALPEISFNRSNSQTLNVNIEPHLDNNKLNYTVNAGKGGVFVVLDAWHPLWKVRVNGVSKEIFKANMIFKAVTLEPGVSNVEFYFDTSLYYFGAYISLIFLIVACLFGIFHLHLIIHRKKNKITNLFS